MCAMAQDFSRRLTWIGAPASLIEGALVMALDELEHGVAAQEVLESTGSSELVNFDPASFKLYRSDDPTVDLALMAVSNLCLGETLAVRVSRGLRDNAVVGSAALALDRVVTDEPRHAALGWQTLDWLLGGPEEEKVRRTITDHLPSWICDYRQAFAGVEVEPHLRNLRSQDLEWGLASPEFHREAFERTLVRDWAPRLARRGIDLPG